LLRRVPCPKVYVYQGLSVSGNDDGYADTACSHATNITCTHRMQISHHVHAYIHTSIHAYIHTYIVVCVCVCLCVYVCLVCVVGVLLRLAAG
jgi:hypothetical protein